MTIAVLDYGSGNLRSVAHALQTVGGDVEVTGEAAKVRRARGLVIPGVGHFGSCMTAIRERGLDVTIDDFISTGRPVFGVCVGMQVLFDGSMEAPGVPGLGVFLTTVQRLNDLSKNRFVGKVPNMGWMIVTWGAPRHAYVVDVGDNAWFYFAHSYAARTAEAVGTAPHGVGDFAAAVAKDNVFATQFHPERSGRAGLALYRGFVLDAGR